MTVVRLLLVSVRNSIVKGKKNQRTYALLYCLNLKTEIKFHHVTLFLVVKVRFYQR